MNRSSINPVNDTNLSQSYGSGSYSMSYDNQRSQNKNMQIKWSKLLNEDLEELLKEKAAVLLEGKKHPN